MTQVFLSLGSNIAANHHIQLAIEKLRQLFTQVTCSPIYESEAVGFSGDNFLNLVVEIETDSELAVLVKQLKTIEDTLGRERSGPKFSSRVIDIDVIFFGNAVGNFNGIELPRYEVYENAYVLLPMKELAPDFVDPKSKLSMMQLWQTSQETMQQQKLWLYSK